MNHNSTFVWHKSWFCFDDQIVCLGSDIANNDTGNPTVTTLFQSLLPATSTPTVLNGTSITSFPYATTSAAMGALAADYTNAATTPYEVLQRNTTAHVVRWKPDGRIGYALFHTHALAAAVTNASPLCAVSLPCLVMTQPTNALLWLTVVNPDLNLINNASTPTNVDVTVVGNWSITSGPTNASILSATASATVVRCQTVHGLPVEVLLVPAGKVTPMLVAPSASAIYSGQTLANSTLSGGTATNPYTGVAVAGTFSFTSPGIVPTVGTTNVGVTFYPVDTVYYSNAFTTVSVTVLPVVTGETFQWDADTTIAAAPDGSGTWDAAAPKWLYASNNVAWSDHNVATLGVNTVTNCTVSLASEVTPAGITFNATSGTYTLAGTNSIWTTDHLNLIVSNNAVIAAPITGAGVLTNTVFGSVGGAIDTSIFSTTLSNAITGSGSLTKLGAGTLALTASNSFTGNLNLSNGTVRVNAQLGSGPVSVAPAGTLSGTGTVGGTVAVNGTVAPGNGAVGTLNTGGQIWNGGGAYQFHLSNATNSSGWDVLNISGALDLQSAANNPFTIKLVSLTGGGTPGLLAGFTNTGTYVWTLASVSGGIQNFDPAKFAADTTAFSNAFTGTFAVSTNAGAWLLTYANGIPVPPTVGSPVLGPGSSFSFSFSGPEGQSFHVYSTTNLTSPLSGWNVVTNGVFGPGQIISSETASTNAQKFFRVGSP